MDDPLTLSARPGGGFLAAPAGRRPSLTRAKREVFLATLAQTANVTRAAQFAGVNRQTVYNARAKDPAFREAWDFVLSEAYVTLELQLLSEALEGREVVVDAGAEPRVVMRQDTPLRLKLLAIGRNRARTAPARLPSAERTRAARARVDAELARMAERLGVEDPDARADDDE